MRLRIDELTAELAARDETLTVLLEQASLLEEAAAADRAEWEQLHQWVAEVERRVEANDGNGGDREHELELERRRGESLAAQIETDRRAWLTRKHQLEEEIERLREACRAAQAEEGSEAAVAAIVEENDWLRARCLELEAAANTAPEGEGLRERLDDALAKMDAARVELRRSEDQRRLEKNEHEAIVSSLKSQMARQTLQSAVLAPENGTPGEGQSAVEADMRIRAFREHLKELHERDAVERSNRGLASKLSRSGANIIERDPAAGYLVPGGGRS